MTTKEKNILRGVDNLKMITALLNGIIQESGKIDINNKMIWQGFLHQPEIDNQFWEDSLMALEWLMECAPEDFTATNKAQIWDARSAFDQYKHLNPRVWDSKVQGKSQKGYAWKTIMTAREVINKINGQDIPNQ